MIKNAFYDLSGGINQAETKTALGLDIKRLYWADSKNIEILQNKGFIRQKGNIVFAKLPAAEKIIAMHQIKNKNVYSLIIVTISGKIYIFTPKTQEMKLLEKTVSGNSVPIFTDFLDGVIVSGKYDEAFYIKNNANYDVESCNLTDDLDNIIYTTAVTTYKGRVWAASNSTVYYSALGKYNDFKTTGDAGYINNFYTDTDEITALKVYKDYLAIYKKNKVYLLSGSTIEDFKITPFADKGTQASHAVVNVNNKQYFVNNSILPLVVGDLNQVILGQEISGNIRFEFDKFDKTRFDEIIALHFDGKNQIWFLIPYKDVTYFYTIWIYDYENNAWLKRVLPQNITYACNFDEYILTCDSEGNIYQENIGNTFNGNAIEFLWKSPFVILGEANIRKTIDEFYFVCDESYDNNFKFSVYKNYDGDYQEDNDIIFSTNVTNLNWNSENSPTELQYNWSTEDNPSYWAVSTNSTYKADITEANYCVQLCVSGSEAAQSAAVIGLEFKEVFADE